MKTLLIDLDSEKILDVHEDTMYVVWPSHNSTSKLELNFVNSGVSAEIVGLFVVSKNKQINFETVANHKVPSTSCLTVVRGVLLEEGQADYIGKIIINKRATETSSFLENSSLVVGENTKNNSQPILEIENNEVKASHGSTTGRISKDMLYYLMSRGIDKTDAEEMIIEGFFNSILGKIKDEEIVKILKERLKNELTIN